MTTDTGGPAKLKPCPFCGSDRVTSRADTVRKEDRIGCDECGCKSPIPFKGEDVFEMWDNRPTEKAAREEGHRQGLDDLAVQGYLTMGNCAHYWEGPGSCPVCIEIKAARKEEREEVLELAKFTIFNTEANNLDEETGLIKAFNAVDAAYHERFGS